MGKIDILLLFIIILSGLLGWGLNELYENCFQDEQTIGRKYDGSYIHSTNNKTTVLEIVKKKDGRGDWVCINVAYEMTPERAYKTCVHECTHKAFSEIYAEEYEQHPSECFKEIWDTNEMGETLNSTSKS